MTAALRPVMAVTRVPRYSPHAVAEHTIALILTLNRKIHRAFVRVRELRALMPWPHIPWMLLGLVVGLVALRVLRGALERRLLPAFSLYLVPLGVATIAWGYARP